jgi:hypothetical protein
MKLASLKETSCRETDIIFRASSSVLPTLLFLTLFVGAAYLVIYGRIGSFDPPRFIAAFSGLFFLLFAAVFYKAWRASRRATNWLLRIRGNEVLIKFRSYQNWKLSEDDVQVIELHRDDIAFVRQRAQKQISRASDDDGVEVDRRVDLEIGLRQPDTTALQKALAAEIARPGWGTDRSRAKVLDYPVTAEDGMIRVAWRNKSTRITPGIGRVLEQLAHLAKVTDTQETTEDFTPSALKDLDPDQQQQKLAELARRDEMAAIRAARKLYGCSLAEAVEKVKELAASPSQSPRRF